MSDIPPPPKPEASKRKAWVYAAEARPTFADWRAGGDRRKGFLRYWVEDNIWNVLNFVGHYGLKLLPMDACSNAGARLGVFAVPRFHKVAARRAKATIARLRPDLDAAEQQALFIENCKAQGRLMTEFSVVNRLLKHPERIRLHNFERLRDTAKAGPTIIVGMHLGNWEIGPTILNADGIRPFANYTPPKGRAKAWISERVRRKGGLNFLPPGAQGIRPSVKLLREGGVISMFCDEGAGGKIRGPLFGRPVHQEGNLAVAIRLARMTGAKICPWYNIRTEGFRFEAFFLPPISLPPEEKPGERLLEDIRLLNSVIEPVILAHLDQWFFVDNALPEG